MAVTLHGGILLAQLQWTRMSANSPIWKTTLAPHIKIDQQDQLFVAPTTPKTPKSQKRRMHADANADPEAEEAEADAHSLIRARVPNGKPWNPMEGFNLTAGPGSYNIARGTMRSNSNA